MGAISATCGDFCVGARKRRERSIRTSPGVAITSPRKITMRRRNRNRVHRIVRHTRYDIIAET